MGRFFTSTQIYNPKQLDRDGFKADFCKKMKKEGYEVCEADCAELSYVLAFADNCKWVTISSEAYEQGNRTAQADTARIAKMLGTYCVNTIVIDSDCAMLDLYDDKGKKTDTLVMGRADDYLGDDIPAPAKAVWEKFLSADSTWEQFISVVQGDYVFVEDGLSELAPVIGMDGGNILFEYEDADESNENFCYLSFRKASSKKEKKLTLNAAFNQVFGEALEPLGFVKIKSRYPYFVRVVNGEILHVITCLTESSGFRGKKAFQIYGGIATVYRDNIDLSISPNENKEWLETNSLLYYRVANRCTKSMVNKMDYYLYEEDDIKSMLSELKKALNITKQIMILYFDTIQNIDTCINHFFKLSGRVYTFSDYFEGLIFLKTANYVQLIEENIKQHRAIYKRNVDLKKKGFTQEEYEKRCQRHELVLKRELAPIENILTIPELYTKYNKELERRKKYNLEILKSYGIDSEKTQPKKEKKLTINAAFKQVFGELLEPMGFKLVKSKHPYFVRVVNGEILHVITYKTEQAQYPEDKAFNILCGVATIYRQQIDLNAGIRANYNWLRNSIADFYAIPLGNEYDNYFRQTISRFNYFSTIESSLINVMKEASILTEKYVLPVINEINTLENCITFFQKYKLPFSTNDYRKNINFNDCNPEDEGFLYIQADYIAKKNKLEEILSSPDINEIKRNRTKEIYSFFIESEIRNIALAELQRRKNANLEILKSYGIDFEKPQPKKEKKLTINAAFKQVFGELLEPMGFKLIKSKYPYYLRVVGEEIIQAISFAKKKSLNLDLNRDEEEVEIYVGISLLSNPLINFDKNPTIIDNQVWMISLNELYRRFIVYMDVFNRKHEEYSFFYQKGNIEEVLNALKQSRDELMPFVLEFLEKPKTLEDIYRLGEITSGIRHDTIILLQKIDELIKELKENLTKKIEMLESVHKDNPERLELLKKRAIEGSEKSIEYFGSFKKGGEKYDDYIKTAEKTKEENIEKLKSYGIPLE